MPVIDSDLILLDAATVYDPWTVDHVVIPMLTALNGVHPIYCLLFAYVWESYETLPFRELASLKDSLLVDPIEAILGSWAGWLFCNCRKKGLLPLLREMWQRPLTHLASHTFLFIIVVTSIRGSFYPSEGVSGPKKYIFTSFALLVLMFYFFYRTRNQSWRWILPVSVAVFIPIVHYITNNHGNTFHIACLYWGVFNVIATVVYYTSHHRAKETRRLVNGAHD